MSCVAYTAVNLSRWVQARTAAAITDQDEEESPNQSMRTLFLASPAAVPMLVHEENLIGKEFLLRLLLQQTRPYHCWYEIAALSGVLSGKCQRCPCSSLSFSDSVDTQPLFVFVVGVATDDGVYEVKSSCCPNT